MAAGTLPKLANDKGVDEIRVGVKEFECMGASPPHDHPHVYLDMGQDTSIVCPYCSARFVHDASLKADESVPPHCLFGVTAG